MKSTILNSPSVPPEKELEFPILMRHKQDKTFIVAFRDCNEGVIMTFDEDLDHNLFEIDYFTISCFEPLPDGMQVVLSNS